MAERKVNYTPEMTEKIKADYANGVSIEAISAEIGKSTRSVISKLVREGVYNAPEKPVSEPRDNGPTKKELLRDLAARVPNVPVDGLNGATKEAISFLIALFPEPEATEAPEAE